MSRSSVIAILAAAGIVYTGPLTSDVIALARAIVSSDNSQVDAFVQQFPESTLAPSAIRLAVNHRGKGSSGNNGDGFGGNPSSGGNMGSGNGKSRGNASYSG